MTLDEFYKLYPTYKDNPNFVNNPNLLLQKIESKFGVPLSDLSKENLQKGLYLPNDAVLNLRVNVPTYGGGSGELDLGNMARTFLQGVTFGYGDEIEASLTGSDVNTIREEINNYTKENPKSASNISDVTTPDELKN